MEAQGLGLSVAHGIVTDHGGVIQVDSAVEGGTTITIDLPFESESRPDEGLRQPKRERDAIRSNAIGPLLPATQN